MFESHWIFWYLVELSKSGDIFHANHKFFTIILEELLKSDDYNNIIITVIEISDTFENLSIAGRDAKEYWL